MPLIRAHSLYEAFLNFTISSPRPEGVPSHIIPNAKYHDEMAAKLRVAVREYRHLGENSGWVPAAKQVVTYLPASVNGSYYAVRTLDPAGSVVEVNEDYMLDVLRVRYALVFAVLPGALLSDEGEAFERYWQKAWKDLLVTGNGFANVFIPGDDMERADTGTTVDIQLEMGGAKATMPIHRNSG